MLECQIACHLMAKHHAISKLIRSHRRLTIIQINFENQLSQLRAGRAEVGRRVASW